VYQVGDQTKERCNRMS